jgi:hypothetical protein
VDGGVDAVAAGVVEGVAGVTTTGVVGWDVGVGVIGVAEGVTEGVEGVPVAGVLVAVGVGATPPADAAGVLVPGVVTGVPDPLAVGDPGAVIGAPAGFEPAAVGVGVVGPDGVAAVEVPATGRLAAGVSATAVG